VELHRATGELPGALARLREIIEIEPKDTGARLLLASLLERSGQPALAVTEYEAVLAVDPAQEVAANNLASLLLKMSDDPAAAQRALDLARRFETSEQPAFLDTLGWSYVASGQSTKGVDLLERAAAAAPRNREILCHLAVARGHAGQGHDLENINEMCGEALRAQDARLARIIEELPPT